MAIPTGYLRGNFNRFWTYDAPSKILTEVTSRVPNGCGNNSAYTFSTNYGGVIISDGTLAYAMGDYGVGIPKGGPVSFFGSYSYPCGSSDTSEDVAEDAVGEVLGGSVKPVASAVTEALIAISLPSSTPGIGSDRTAPRAGEPL